MSKKFNKEELFALLDELNRRLILEDKTLEMYIYGGACLSLAYNMRRGDNDIDAIFGDKNTVNRLVRSISKDYGLKENWLNDSVKGFTTPGLDYIIANQKFSNIKIKFPTKEVLLAMKLVSSRLEDSQDLVDIKNLSKSLNFTKEEEFWNLLEKYYPINLILPKTGHAILEFLEEINKTNNTKLSW